MLPAQHTDFFIALCHARSISIFFDTHYQMNFKLWFLKFSRFLWNLACLRVAIKFNVIDTTPITSISLSIECDSAFTIGLIQYNRCHRAGFDLTGNKATHDAQCDRHALFSSVQQHYCQCTIGIHKGHCFQLIRVAGCRNPFCSWQYIMTELFNVVVR